MWSATSKAAPGGACDVWMLAPDGIALNESEGVTNNHEGSWVRVLKGDSPTATTQFWSFEQTPPPTRHPTPVQLDDNLCIDDKLCIDNSLVRIEEVPDVN